MFGIYFIRETTWPFIQPKVRRLGPLFSLKYNNFSICDPKKKGEKKEKKLEDVCKNQSKKTLANWMQYVEPNIMHGIALWENLIGGSSHIFSNQPQFALTFLYTCIEFPKIGMSLVLLCMILLLSWLHVTFKWNGNIMGSKMLTGQRLSWASMPQKHQGCS